MEERTFPNSFYKGSIIPKPNKASRKKKKENLQVKDLREYTQKS